MNFVAALAADLPVVFANIGWAIHYDGREVITGNHSYIREHPGDAVGESKAFRSTGSSGYYRCGIGRGSVPNPLHVVYVARHPGSQILKVVGLYAGARISLESNNWAIARTSTAHRIPIEQRPPVIDWPNGQGMRRWADRKGHLGTEYKSLLAQFHSIKNALSSKNGLTGSIVTVAADEEAFEGELKKLYIRHRKREHSLRAKKIATALQSNGGHLVCEVPGCGFDFHARYGELGAGFAEVHHKKPLSDAPAEGHAVALSDLAIVCANCHRMIHLNGECRSLRGLIPVTRNPSTRFQKGIGTA